MSELIVHVASFLRIYLHRIFGCSTEMIYARSEDPRSYPARGLYAATTNPFRVSPRRSPRTCGRESIDCTSKGRPRHSSTCAIVRPRFGTNYSKTRMRRVNARIALLLGCSPKGSPFGFCRRNHIMILLWSLEKRVGF